MELDDVQTLPVPAHGGAVDERALAFDGGGERLYGILTLPPAPSARGVLIVVGGPQYRAGSHRQFTLLARSLAQEGIAAFRFDYRGMGDSGGMVRAFDDVEDDLRAAIDTMLAAVPALREVVLWGLCDAASAIGMYAARDARVAGLVLLNPWVRTDEGLARATLRHYYSAQLRNGAFWRRVLSGQFSWRKSLSSLVALTRQAARQPGPAQSTGPACSLPDRMHAGLRDFGGPILLVLSGSDLTAREFSDLADADAHWRRTLAPPRVRRYQIDSADHTFSRREWRDQVARWTADWLRSW